MLLVLGWEPGAALDMIQSQRPYAQVKYAEDACLWFHSVSKPSTAQQSADYAAISQWRRDWSNVV